MTTGTNEKVRQFDAMTTISRWSPRQEGDSEGTWNVFGAMVFLVSISGSDAEVCGVTSLSRPLSGLLKAAQASAGFYKIGNVPFRWSGAALAVLEVDMDPEMKISETRRGVPIHVGDYVQFSHRNGSVGIVVAPANATASGFVYVRWFYGNDKRGDYMTALQQIESKNLDHITQDELNAIASRDGWSDEKGG